MSGLLTEQEKQSALWGKISARLDERLASLRMQNDTEQTESETSILRGRIAEVKVLQALGRPTPKD